MRTGCIFTFISWYTNHWPIILMGIETRYELDEKNRKFKLKNEKKLSLTKEIVGVRIL